MLSRICLALPTHRACEPTISAVAAEAAYAARTFGVEVALVILDSSDPATFARHAAAVIALPDVPGVEVLHLDEGAQRRFLTYVIGVAGVADPDLIARLMLPDAVSYGACTNRAFLIGAALECESVHRRDSDMSYQSHDGEDVYPVHNELAFLSRPASEAASDVSEVALDDAHADKPVVMVGSSFVGALSVDIEDIRQSAPDVYGDIVRLWAVEGATAQECAELVEESFTGAGAEPFSQDWTVLGLVDPMRIDMCNISFYRVHEKIPLPPMTETIGSDYFLIHLVPDCRLPGVRHNRNIINFHTPDRKTEHATLAYHLRLAKFFLSMLYLHAIYQGMAKAGEELLDEHLDVRAPRIVELVRASVLLDRTPNVRRLHHLDAAYRRLGGIYAQIADQLAERGDALLTEVTQDFEDFATLVECWQPLIRASRSAGADRLRQ